MSSRINSVTVSLCSILLLTACNGGGSGDSSTNNPFNAGVAPATTNTTTTPGSSNGSVQSFLEESNSGLQLGDAGLCTTEGINAWVDAQMRDYYIYADQVPVVDPSEYANANLLLSDLRVAPDVFSSITPSAARTALFEAGETFGFGFRWRRDQAGALRFLSVTSGSPLEAAGGVRGDRVLALNGIPELNITDNMFAEIFGEQNEPTTVTFTLENDGEIRVIEATSSVYTINTVPRVESFVFNGATVGYIESSVFLRTSEAELDAAIENLVEANPTDVILDFRYNGGGFVFVAQKLAAQLAGTNFTGQVFQRTTFNERYSRFNTFSELEAQDLNLNLPRVIVLTTGSTASASEAIANNLRPYLDVVVIGSQTAGKPFASVSNRNCDLALNAMDRITSNNNDETVLGGLTPTCEVTDEFRYPMFSTEDALFGSALTYLRTNACPNPTIDATDSFELRSVVLKAPIDEFKDTDMPTGMFLQ